MKVSMGYGSNSAILSFRFRIGFPVWFCSECQFYWLLCLASAPGVSSLHHIQIHATKNHIQIHPNSVCKQWSESWEATERKGLKNAFIK